MTECNVFFQVSPMILYDSTAMGEDGEGDDGSWGFARDWVLKEKPNVLKIFIILEDF